ncbi:GroES-like protein [Microthyrium microscopicum]|uniref:GroES-like protein n=1 Tax=Microthyrium microscopicum TaxID=703497 RepID=A0A6A6UG09_9PEZI|nr:GroES-like protein [Microthyrium microscopicum]
MTSTTPNEAIIIPAAKAPLEIILVETYTPGPKELLIRNEAIALNPAEWKIAKLGIFPLNYPVISGFSFGGTVTSIGSSVTRFQVGDRVAASMYFPPKQGNQYGGYQKFVVVGEETAAKVPDAVDIATGAALTGNLTTVVGIFEGRLGLGKPDFEKGVVGKGEKVLVYGGSSSLGSLSVQYVAQAGYEVVTTSSPRNMGWVSGLGATAVVDHTLGDEETAKALIERGPYVAVVDTISLEDTILVNKKVLDAQGGGTLFGVAVSAEDKIPEGLTYESMSWPAILHEERNAGLMSWSFHEYLEQALAKGKLITPPIEKIGGGLKGVQVALDKLEKGVSGVKLVVDPR